MSRIDCYALPDSFVPVRGRWIYYFLRFPLRRGIKLRLGVAGLHVLLSML